MGILRAHTSTAGCIGLNKQLCDVTTFQQHETGMCAPNVTANLQWKRFHYPNPSTNPINAKIEIRVGKCTFRLCMVNSSPPQINSVQT